MEEQARAMVTKILATKEPAHHLNIKDPEEEEDSKTSQDLLDSNQIQNNFKTARLIMSSPPAVAGGTRSCSKGPPWP